MGNESSASLVDTRQLKSGEILTVELFNPGTQAAPAAQALRDFVVQVEGGVTHWIALVDDIYLTRAVQGEFIASGLDLFWVGRLDGQMVGAVGCQVASDAPEIGSLGWVFTTPSQRGKGISSCLTEIAVTWFRERGGLVMYLGTVNPVARHIYATQGFRDYDGIVMRYVRPGVEAATVDAQLFAYTGRAQVRPVCWGDASRVAALYTAPHPWFCADYLECLFAHPTLSRRRYFSIFPSMLVQVEQRKGSFFVLETPGRHIVGAARYVPVDALTQAHVGVVDFLLYPTYNEQAGDLLLAVVAAARTHGLSVLQANFAVCDNDKKALAEQIGFRPVARLANQFKVRQEQFDLEVYQLVL